MIITQNEKTLRAITLELEQIQIEVEAVKSLSLIGEMTQNSGLSNLNYTAQFVAIWERADKIYKTYEKISSIIEQSGKDV